MNHSSLRLLSAAAVGAALGLSLQVLAPGTPAFAAGLPVTYSTYNAGYSVYSASFPPAAVSAQFLVPAVTCTKAKEAIDFGVFAEGSTDEAGAAPGVAVSCLKGAPHYTAYIYLDGSFGALSTTVQANNAVTVSASETPAGASATFTDSSTGFSRTQTGAGATAYEGSIGSYPGGTKKIPAFSTVSFTGATVNGLGIGTYTEATGLSEGVATKKGVAPPKGKVEIEPGALGTSSFPLSMVGAG